MAGATTDQAFHTYNEIMSQPQVWRATLDAFAGMAQQIQAAAGGTAPEAMFVGCGSPFFLARSAAAMYQMVTGAPAQAVPASDLLLFPDAVLVQRPRLLVAISRSGETTELLHALKLFAERNGSPVIAVTCYDDRPLIPQATLALVARAAHEQSVAQTRSFTSMLLGTQAVIAALAGQPWSDAFVRLPDACAALLHEHAELARQLGGDSSIERFFFLGSGPLYGLACEAMLKMKEMSLSYSEAYTFLEFRHGPMSMVNDRTLVIGFVSDQAAVHEAAVLGDMRGLGARVLALSPVALPAGHFDHMVRLPAGLTDVERGALYLPVSQLMTFYRALHNGVNPDSPNNLNAVVHLDMDTIARQALPSQLA